MYTASAILFALIVAPAASGGVFDFENQPATTLPDGTPTGGGGACEQLFLVNFEGVIEGTEISDQTATPQGVTFSMVGQPGVFPIIAVEGSPPIGFVSTSAGDDAPMVSGVAGLTDPLVDGLPGVPGDIRLDFDPPVESVRMGIIDIDQSESYTVRAFDGATEVDWQTRTAGDPDTGDGVASKFEVGAATIDSVMIEVDGPADATGFAVDFLTFTRQTSCDAAPEIFIQQESAPGAGDFAENTLGSLRAFTASPNVFPPHFYAYDMFDADSWNGLSLAPVADRSHLLVAQTSDGLSLVIVHDNVVPGGPAGTVDGSAEVRVEVLGDPDGASRSVEDDPMELDDAYSGDPGDSVFAARHAWAECCTDGQVITGIENAASTIVAFTEVDSNPATLPIDGLSDWRAISADGTQIPLALQPDRRVRLTMTDPLCPADFDGDGAVGITDFLALLAAWGPTPGHPADLDGDGFVGITDFLDLLAQWGPCP